MSLGDDGSDAEQPDPPEDPASILTPEQIKAINAEVKKRPEMFAAFKASMYQGQFPHPEIIEGWETQCPGSADRILSMAERQQAHRIELEGVAIRASIARSTKGLETGRLIAILFLAVAGLLIGLGHDVAGGVLGTVDLVALVTVFVVGKEAQKAELSGKAGERASLGNPRERSADVRGESRRPPEDPPPA